MSQLLTIFNKLSADSLFTYYQALYWYASENHEGQFTQLYSILSTLPYKPSLSETSDNCDYDILFDLDRGVLDASLLATALRLYSLLSSCSNFNSFPDVRKFHALHYFEAKDLYLAEYRDYDDEDDYSTYYAVYSVSECGTIIDETIVD